jgi:hypothetical protein
MNPQLHCQYSNSVERMAARPSRWPPGSRDPEPLVEHRGDYSTAVSANKMAPPPGLRQVLAKDFGKKFAASDAA